MQLFSGPFVRFYERNLLCFVVAMCDLVHNVETDCTGHMLTAVIA